MYGEDTDGLCAAAERRPSVYQWATNGPMHSRRET
jgi:hypothetical protein